MIHNYEAGEIVLRTNNAERFSIESGGKIDLSSSTAIELYHAAAPVVDETGEIALDSDITDHTDLLKYYGDEELVVIALPTANLSTADGHVIAYNATNNEFEMVSNAGGGGGGDVTGGSTSVDHELVRYDGTSGKAIAAVTSDAPILGDDGRLETFNDLVVTLSAEDSLFVRGQINHTSTHFAVQIEPESNGTGDFYALHAAPTIASGTGALFALEGNTFNALHRADSTRHHAVTAAARGDDNGFDETINMAVWALAERAEHNISGWMATGSFMVGDSVSFGKWDRRKTSINQTFRIDKSTLISAKPSYP